MLSITNSSKFLLADCLINLARTAGIALLFLAIFLCGPSFAQSAPSSSSDSNSQGSCVITEKNSAHAIDLVRSTSVFHRIDTRYLGKKIVFRSSGDEDANKSGSCFILIAVYVDEGDHLGLITVFKTDTRSGYLAVIDDDGIFREITR